MEAYLFLDCSSGMIWDIADQILEIAGVKMTHVVTGNFDVIAFANFSDIDELTRIIQNVQSIKGVQKTQTAVAIPRRES